MIIVDYFHKLLSFIFWFLSIDIYSFYTKLIIIKKIVKFKIKNY